MTSFTHAARKDALDTCRWFRREIAAHKGYTARAEAHRQNLRARMREQLSLARNAHAEIMRRKLA